MNKLLVVCFVLYTTHCVVASPMLSFNNVSSSGKYTSTLVTDIDADTAIIPSATDPPTTSTVAVHVVATGGTTNTTSYICSFKVTGTGDAGGRVGIRLSAGSKVNTASYSLKIGSQAVKTISTTAVSYYTATASIGDDVTLTLATSSSSVRTAIACLQIAQAPAITISGSMHPALSSYTFQDVITPTLVADTDPFRDGIQITRGGKLNLKYAVSAITCERDAMFPAFSYNANPYVTGASIYDDDIYLRHITKLRTDTGDVEFYDTQTIYVGNTLAKSLSSLVMNYKFLNVAGVPNILAADWFRIVFQVKLFQNCGTTASPVFVPIDDETSDLSTQQFQMLERPTVTCTGLEATTFRRAYPVEVPISIMLGATPAAGKQVLILDENDTTVCNRVLDENGATTVPVVVPSNFVNGTFERRIRWVSDEPLWNSVNLIKGGLTVRNVNGNSISGKLTLEGGTANPSDIACMIRLQRIENLAIVSTQYRYPVIVTSGNYQLQDIDTGTYRVLIAPIKYQLDYPEKSRWLSLVLGQMNMFASTQSANNNASLKSGDISSEDGLGTRDNSINLADLLALIGRYGTSVRSATWSPEVDLDSDGEVTLFDVMVIDRNWMAQGDD